MLSLKEKIKNQLSLSSEVKILRVIDKIFNFAIGCEAEEIFFEPRAKDLAVIFSSGGEIKNTLLLPKKAEQAVIAAIKEMAGLNYPGDNAPPGGKFKKDYLGYKIIFSLAVHPAASGERLAVSLTREKFKLLGLGRLGLNKESLRLVKKAMAGGKGIVLVIGASNSGRTSTLYSFIDFLKSPGLNIATVEREIAADLPEINQSRLNPAAGFGSGAAVNALRRQDADVVMIGEINDRETAEAALHLADSGHFVLAGIEGRDATAALNYLKDLGAPLALFSANAKLMITQRLVGKNCPYCLGKKKIGSDNLRRLEQKLSLKKLLPRLKRDKIISGKIADTEDLVFYRGRGCPRCQNRGSLGKIGIFEVLEITPAVKSLIRGGHFSAISAELKKQNSYSLAEDALIKSLNGLITVEEVFKAVSHR
jgi:type II secretory ATPase GspE/PulE/Tfp pilus assembly ATPase PilB-like protein